VKSQAGQDSTPEGKQLRGIERVYVGRRVRKDSQRMPLAHDDGTPVGAALLCAMLQKSSLDAACQPGWWKMWFAMLVQASGVLLCEILRVISCGLSYST
jgi:hypothetical protein